MKHIKDFIKEQKINLISLLFGISISMLIQLKIAIPEYAFLQPILTLFQIGVISYFSRNLISKVMKS